MATPLGHALLRSLTLPHAVQMASHDGFPQSGLTRAGASGKGSILIDKTTGVAFVNEGSKDSPYWSPMSLTGQPRLQGFGTDFRDGVGKDTSNTDAVALLASGVRVFGDGIAEGDSGLVVTWTAGRGPIGQLITTNENHKLAGAQHWRGVAALSA